MFSNIVIEYEVGQTKVLVTDQNSTFKNCVGGLCRGLGVGDIRLSSSQMLLMSVILSGLKFIWITLKGFLVVSGGCSPSFCTALHPQKLYRSITHFARSRLIQQT
jgi:hypothetical protein